MSNGLPSSLTHCSPHSQDSAGPCLFSVSTSLLFYSTLHKALFLLLLSHSPALSAQSLVFSVDHNREKVLPLLSLHWLFRWSSHPALLCSQSLKVKEIKHKNRVLACKLSWCKGETISLLYFINPISLSLLLAPLLSVPGKLMLFVMMFCLPSASVHSLPPPATHQPLASIACFLCISRRPQK